MKTHAALPISLLLPLWSAAQNTASIAFDGVDDYVDCGTSSMFELTDSVTLEAWVKVDITQFNPFGRIIDKFNHVEDEGVNLISNGGHLFMEIRDPNGDGYSVYGSSIDDGSWHHVAGSFSGTELKIYIDGVLDDQYSFTATTIAPSANALSIGNGWDGAAYLPLHGSIDEVRIWNIVRTEAEILACMNSRLDGNEPGLLGYWRLDENSGITTADLTGFGNDGTLGNGAAWSTDVLFPGLGDCSITAIGENDGGPALELRPNPMITSSELMIDAMTAGACTVAIHDLSGRAVRTWLGVTARRFIVDREGLKPGTYMLNVAPASGRTTSLRLVIL